MTSSIVRSVRVGSIIVSASRRVVEIDGVAIRLTRAEMAVLTMLMQAAPDPVPRWALDAVARLGSATRASRTRLVDQRIYTLRQKLGDNARRPTVIVSVVGVGYAFNGLTSVGDAPHELVMTG